MNKRMERNILSDLSVVITGGTSGVGQATALLLASRGARIMTCGRAKEGVERIQTEMRAFHPDCYAIQTDISNYEDVQNLFKAAENYFGTVDVLINNAGVPANSILNTDISEWASIVGVNLLGYMYASYYAIPLMKKKGRGHIINIGSLTVKVIDNGADIYVATKTGVAGFTQSLRKELVRETIKVTLINPGAIRSGMIIPTEEEQKNQKFNIEMLQPEDVADAIYYAMSQPDNVDVTEVDVRIHNQSNL